MSPGLDVVVVTKLVTHPMRAPDSAQVGISSGGLSGLLVASSPSPLHRRPDVLASHPSVDVAPSAIATSVT